MSAAPVAGTEDHPQARIVLGAALATQPSHAYLFHGPAGTGKRTVARAFAAELLAEGEPDPEDTRRRALGGSHPDLTWVRPTGAHVMRTSDVDEAVIGAATRTPFEARRRVFVLERVETMNDEVANRMLKTLEEPASFVHLILLTDSLGQVLETVVSRCQAVRFDPLPADRIASALESEGVPADQALACGRLALGNAERARYLASEEGSELRSEVESFIAAALEGEQGGEAWQPLLARAEARRAEAEEAAKRDGRRARTEVLDLGLSLAALGFRDLVCLAEGADGSVLATDRAPVLGERVRGRDPRRLRQAAERIEDTRQSLELNVAEDLALSALGFRLASLVGTS